MTAQNWIVDTAWLAEHLNAPGLIVLDGSWHLPTAKRDPKAEYLTEHIPGAVLLNEDEWVRLVGPFLDAWEPEKTIVVYCDGGSCDASHAVARRIKTELQVGSTIWVLHGGWDAWLERK